MTVEMITSQAPAEQSPCAPGVTVAILTYNEARRLPDALRSIPAGLPVLVVDGYSTDSTVQIAESFGAQVILSDRLGPENPGGFSEQRNLAIEQSTTEWVFFLDADERFTPELSEELTSLVARGAPVGCDAFRVQRVEHFWGVRTEYTHGKAWQTRLLRRSSCRYDSRRVHETPLFIGRMESLQSALLHYSKDSVSDYVATMNRYTSLEAEHACAEGRPLAATPLWPVLKTFAHVYVYKRGYREGAFGFGMALLFAMYRGLCWIKQWEIGLKSGRYDSTYPRGRAAEVTAGVLSRMWRALRPPRDQPREVA